MKNRLSRRHTIGAAGVLVAGSLVASGAWGYLTTFGNGTANATITQSGPAVMASATTGQLRPDRNDAISVIVTNPLDHAITVTRIPVGTSRGYAVNLGDGFDCVAGSVTAGALDPDGNYVPSGNGSDPLPDSAGSTTIAAGTFGEFRLWARFDTLSFPNDNQDGCLGQTVELNFGPVQYTDS